MFTSYKKKFSAHSITLILALSLLSASCSSHSNLVSQYGDDANYFIALREIQEGNSTAAKNHLKKSAKKGSPLIARRSLETLASMGTVKERMDSFISIYKLFPDETSLLEACRELYTYKEYAKIIQLTGDIDLSKCNNELAFYRINALYKLNDQRFQSEYYSWCSTRPFTNEHYKMFCSVPENPELLEFRASVYTQKYAEAFPLVKKIIDQNFNEIFPQLVSDFGKVYLYGSAKYLENAIYFDALAQSLSGPAKFYAWFYAGRMYDRSDAYHSRAMSRFLNAMQTASTPQNYDNALWYYLNTTLKTSLSVTIQELETYASTWHDCYYFDDFFETLSVRLLSQHMWEEFYKTALLIDKKASSETVAKFSYIAARLSECGYLKLNGSEKKSIETSLFKRALTSDTDMYYRLLAASRLNLNTDEVQKLIFSFGKKTQNPIDRSAEKLLSGYADFGFPEYIYDEWKESGSLIGIDTTQKIARFLNQCGTEKNNYYSQSLRIASRKANYPETILYPELLSLVFPRNFKDTVTEVCTKFNQPEYLLYSLIRSESFFDPTIVSHAGAIGLTQLMTSTAGDVSRKLKVAEYDLRDASTNILFGSYYLEEMRRRLDGSCILALFAYNGGITRVRSWVKSANIEFGTSSLPKDLFLEVLPYSETREYGRKTVSASCMYGWLYYEKSISEVVEEILK